jgi:hypothetical protein
MAERTQSPKEGVEYHDDYAVSEHSDWGDSNDSRHVSQDYISFQRMPLESNPNHTISLLSIELSHNVKASTQPTDKVYSRGKTPPPGYVTSPSQTKSWILSRELPPSLMRELLEDRNGWGKKNQNKGRENGESHENGKSIEASGAYRGYHNQGW